MIYIIIVAFVLAVICVGGATLWSLPTVRGMVGEWRVRLKVGTNIPGRQYVINNYQVSVEGGSVQIDHIVINPNGVFVIETKNYSGRIFGAENQTKWTQVLAYGKVKNSLYNPIMQNGMHIKHLSKILNRNGIFRNMVVFVQNNTYEIVSDKLVTLSNLQAVMNTPFLPDGLTPEEMMTLYDALLAYQASHAIRNTEHIQNIETLQSNIENHICPRCGNQLVLRKGRYGEFWGCSQYPNCRFIKKL